MLSEVQTSRSSQLPSSKNLLVLGDKESGKTTLVAKLQGNEDPKKGAGLEYGYIDVRDEYRDGKFGMRKILITVFITFHDSNLYYILTLVN